MTAPLDLEELGVREDQPGLITAISPIDHLAVGPGRVVLTTITRLNSFIFDLTLSTDDGKTGSYGVTGFHKWYSESRGWVSTVDLQEGKELRTATGTARVTTPTIVQSCSSTERPSGLPTVARATRCASTSRSRPATCDRRRQRRIRPPRRQGFCDCEHLTTSPADPVDPRLLRRLRAERQWMRWRRDDDAVIAV